MRYIQQLLCTGGTEQVCARKHQFPVWLFLGNFGRKTNSTAYSSLLIGLNLPFVIWLGDFLLQITSPSMTEIQHQLIHIKTKTGDSPYQREHVFEQYHWPAEHFALTPWEFILYIYIYILYITQQLPGLEWTPHVNHRVNVCLPIPRLHCRYWTLEKMDESQLKNSGFIIFRSI